MRNPLLRLAALALVVGVISCGLCATLVGLASDDTTAQLYNCPLSGHWSVATWSGPDGTPADEALVTCNTVAAYALDPQTGEWTHWFAGKPDLSNLQPLNEMQGLLTLGAVGQPTPIPTPTPRPPLPCPPLAPGQPAPDGCTPVPAETYSPTQTPVIPCPPLMPGQLPPEGCSE